MNAQQTIDNLDTVITMVSDAQRALRALSVMPQTSEELGELLDELASAELGCRGHFVAYESEKKHDWINQSKACRDHWSGCLRRRDRAQERLLKFAVARKES